MSHKIIVTSPRSRVVELDAFESNVNSPEILNFLNRLDEGTPDERDFLKDLDTHWLVFIVKCPNGLCGVLVADKDLQQSKVESLVQFTKKYFSRLFEISSCNNPDECIDAITERFPYIWNKNKPYTVYQF
jgi:hypothetical protein